MLLLVHGLDSRGLIFYSALFINAKTIATMIGRSTVAYTKRLPSERTRGDNGSLYPNKLAHFVKINKNIET